MLYYHDDHDEIEVAFKVKLFLSIHFLELPLILAAFTSKTCIESRHDSFLFLKAFVFHAVNYKTYHKSLLYLGE